METKQNLSATPTATSWLCSCCKTFIAVLFQNAAWNEIISILRLGDDLLIYGKDAVKLKANDRSLANHSNF